MLIISDGDDGNAIDRNVSRALAVQPDVFVFAVRSRVRYKNSVARLLAAPNSTVRYFPLPYTTTNAAKDAGETQAAHLIFDLI